MSYGNLLSEGRIGSLTLRNRVVFPPMGSMFCDKDGFVTQRLIDYHVRRAEGGSGMNILENTATHKSTFNPYAPNIWDDKFNEGLSALTAGVHAAGGKMVCQLAHGGRQESGAPRGHAPWAPSAIPCPFIQEIPHVMTKEEIDDVIRGFGEGAARAKKCGFDAVEVHGSHGYLIDEFLNPYSNTREDEYGGSLENRARFVREVLREVRKSVGPDYPVIFRMNASENVPEGGLVIEEALQVAKWAKEDGIDALDISQGCYTAMAYTVPPYYLPHALNADNAGRFREETGLPVICAGRVNTPDMAEAILKERKADFISIGRGMLADPDFVKKTMEDRPEDIVHCISCNSGCIENSFAGEGLSCVFCAQTGHEKEYSYPKTDTPKNILVIGGGVGGLEAARVAAERGHKVTLFEKTGILGGQFLIAGAAPYKKEFKEAALQMGYRAMKAGVDVKFYTEATKERIEKLHPDFIILAAGSKGRELKFEGEGKLPVYQAREFLNGDVRVKEKTVLVLGGGITGLEAAEVLTEEGKTAIVAEMLDTIGKDLESTIKPYMDEYLSKHRIRTYVKARCTGLAEDGVIAEVDGKEEKIACDALIVAAGSVVDRAVEEMVKATGIPYRAVGDADRPGKMRKAVWAANEIARTI